MIWSVPGLFVNDTRTLTELEAASKTLGRQLNEVRRDYEETIAIIENELESVHKEIDRRRRFGTLRVVGGNDSE